MDIRDAMVLSEKYLQFTYLVLAKGVQRIKIGKARNPQTRMNNMQIGSPVNLELIEYTAGIAEHIFHADELLRCYHVRGEWYTLCYGFIEAFERIVEAVAPNCNFADLDLRDYLLSNNHFNRAQA